MLLHLPYHHQFDPVTLREFGVNHLERLVTKRTQS